MASDRSRYQAFLLRLWLADNGGQPVWRLSLEKPGSSSRRIFHSIAELDSFLLALTGEHADGDRPFANPDLSEDER